MQPSNTTWIVYPRWLSCVCAVLLSLCLPGVIVAAMFGVVFPTPLIVVAGYVSARAMSRVCPAWDRAKHPVYGVIRDTMVLLRRRGATSQRDSVDLRAVC